MYSIHQTYVYPTGGRLIYGRWYFEMFTLALAWDKRRKMSQTEDSTRRRMDGCDRSKTPVQGTEKRKRQEKAGLKALIVWDKQ